MSYPPVKLADDYAEKLKFLPTQAWWAEEDEPMYRIPPDAICAHWLPHRIAIKYGLIVPMDPRATDGRKNETPET